MPHRIFLVEDHAMVREGLARLIDAEEDLVVCGGCDDVHGAIREIQHLLPDAVTVDLSLKRGSGLELIKDLRGRFSRMPILVVSMHDEFGHAERSLRAGASGYVMKTAGIATMIRALRAVLSGEIFVSDAIANRVVALRKLGVDSIQTDPINRLSDRELEIFEQIGNWKSCREIAGELGLSIKTVEFYREQIKKKLGLKGGSALAKAATDWVVLQT